MSSQRQEASAGPARGRAATTDRKIVAAVLSLLVHEGPGRVSIESVAAESGVAKTSIYRRYANTEAMVEDVLERSGDSLAPRPLEIPQDGQWTQRQWTEALDAAVRSLVLDLGTGTAVALLSQPTSEVARILRLHLVRPRIEQLHRLLQRQRHRQHPQQQSLLRHLPPPQHRQHPQPHQRPSQWRYRRRCQHQSPSP